MKIHEYQAKEILETYDVAVPAGVASTTVDEAVEAAQKMKEDGATLFVVKAQIHAGGRGKGQTKESGASGVILCDTIDEVRDAAESLLGDVLVTKQTGEEGQKVQRIYVTDGVEIEQEFYLGILLDRAKSKNVIMVSTEGGMDIETVAEESPEKIVKEWVEPGMDLQHNQARHLVCTSFQSFWGQFGWMGVVMPRHIYVWLAGLSLLLVAGCVWWLFDRKRPRLVDEQRVSLGLLGISALLTLAIFVAYNFTFVQHQGRYFFPALIPLGMGASLGLNQMVSILPHALRRVALVGFFVAMAWFAVYFLFAFVVPFL